MLGQRRRRWPSIIITLAEPLVRSVIIGNNVTTARGASVTPSCESAGKHIHLRYNHFISQSLGFLAVPILFTRARVEPFPCWGISRLSDREYLVWYVIALGGKLCNLISYSLENVSNKYLDFQIRGESFTCSLTACPNFHTIYFIINRYIWECMRWHRYIGNISRQ